MYNAISAFLHRKWIKISWNGIKITNIVCMFSSVGLGRFLVACPTWRPTWFYEGLMGHIYTLGVIDAHKEETNSANYEGLLNCDT